MQGVQKTMGFLFSVQMEKTKGWLRRACTGLVFLLCTAMLLFPSLAEAEASKPEVTYFFENYCDSCHPELDFHEEFRQLTGQDLSGYSYIYYNTAQRHARAVFEQTMERLQVPAAQRLLPFVVLGDRWYAGTTAIRSALPRDFAAGDERTSLIYYLYVTACEGCARAREALDALPPEIEVTRGDYTFLSPVQVVPVDIGGDLGLAQALFDRYQVPEEKRMAPMVLLRDTYLSGADSISRSLAFRLERGEAVGTPVVAAQAADVSALSLLGAIGAGLVGGLNPCALGMLLFFLTVLLSMGRRVGALAAVYLASKLATYLLIGTLLYSAFRLWNPQWLPQALKLVLTALGLGLMALNIMDALAVRRHDHGRIKNQLPQGARQYLHGRMRTLLHGGRALWPSVILVSILVASVEFLCAGQVYLATLLTGIEQGSRGVGMYLMLLAYCLAFLLPSAVLAFVAARGQALPRIAAWVNDRMQLTKWLTAALFAVVIIILWL